MCLLFAGIRRGKACSNWTLVIDDRTELTRAEMKSQLSYTKDIVMKRSRPKTGRLPPGGIASPSRLRYKKTAADLFAAPGSRLVEGSHRVAQVSDEEKEALTESML